MCPEAFSIAANWGYNIKEYKCKNKQVNMKKFVDIQKICKYFVNLNVNVNLIYSGHALSLALSISNIV